LKWPNSPVREHAIQCPSTAKSATEVETSEHWGKTAGRDDAEEK
jgi:hypothetical protein